MKVKMSSMVMSLFLLAALVASACAPAAAPTPAPAPKPAAPAAVATPTSAPAPTLAPAATPTPVVAKPAPTVAPAPTPKPAGPRAGGILKSVGNEDPIHYDLHQLVSYNDLHPLAPLYNLLVKQDERDETKIVSDLAAKWDVSPDGKTYTFYLQKGVKFHDGTPLTSADVKASLERLAWPPKGVSSRREAYYANMSKVETPDDSTVRIVLKQPQGSLPLMGAVPFSVIYPKRILDQKGDMKKDVMGTGPFVLKEHIRGVQMVVEKNPNYFVQGRPYLDGIMRYVIKDDAAIEAAFKTKSIDMIQPNQHRLGGAMLAQLKKAVPEMAALPHTEPILFGFIPNFTRKPWSDIRVRQAVALAMDGAALRDVVEPDAMVGGFITPGSGWETPWEELKSLPGFRKPAPEDIAQAKKLLAEAGYPEGFSFKFLVRSAKIYIDQAVVAKSQVEKIGLKTELDIRESGAFWAARDGLSWDAMLYGAVSVEMSDPDIVFSRVITGSSGNYGKYSNQKVDELFAKQSAAVDPAARKKLALELQRELIKDPVFIPSYWRVTTALLYPKVKGYYNIGSYAGHSLENVWLSE